MTKSNLKSTNLSADGQISGSAQPAHVCGIHYVSSAVAGVINIRNGGAAGAILATIDTPAVIAAQWIDLTRMGLWCSADAYLDIDANVTSATVFWTG